LLLPATIYREQFPLPYILPLSSILSSERLTCYFNTNTAYKTRLQMLPLIYFSWVVSSLDGCHCCRSSKECLMGKIQLIMLQCMIVE